MSSFAINVDLAGLEKSLGAEQAKVAAAVRPAAQAGAQVLYEAVLKNVQAIGKKTGNLQRSIYQVYRVDNSGDAYATYHVASNAKKAPHGSLVEFGHIQKYKVYLGRDGKWHTNKKAPLDTPKQVGARPYIRPALAQFPEAQAAMMAEFLKRLSET